MKSPKWLSDNKVIIFITLITLGLSLVLMAKVITAYPSLTFKKIQNVNITEMIWGAFVINLIIERSLEVFISTWRDPGKAPAEKLSKMHQSLIDQQINIKELEDRIKAGISDTDLLTKIRSKRDNKEKEIETLEKKICDQSENFSEAIIKYQTATKNFSLVGGFLLGLFSSLAGIRVLESFVDISSTLESQRIAFRTLDILLTALAISGGSKVFHELVSILTDFAAQTRSQINLPK
jgi:hypothetical protein